MTILRMLACGSVLLFAVGCSSSSGGNAGGSDGGGSDGTTDGMQSGNDSSSGGGDAPSDTGAGGDSKGNTDGGPYDAGPPGDATSCGFGLSLCNGYCVNGNNDIHNCGGCNVVCQDANPFCDMGHCTSAPCDGGTCGNGTFCCGGACCNAGQLCCDVPSNLPAIPRCTDPVNGTCPIGCLMCP